MKLFWPIGDGLRLLTKRLLPAETCGLYCGSALLYLGEDAAEQLELVRSAFQIIRSLWEKQAC